MTSERKPTIAELIAARKMRDAAAKREKRIAEAVNSGDQTRIDNFLRKGETLAFFDNLRPYQRIAVLQTVKNKRTGTHTLNATAVGLGKTRVAASFVNTLNEFKGGYVLWLTSLTLIGDTCRELSSLGCTVIPVADKSSVFFNVPFPKDRPIIFVTNYEVIKRDPGLWGTYNGGNFPKFVAVIIDEVTKLKGGANARPTQIWMETKDLLHNAHPEAYRLFLSGTPAVNKPDEIWAYLHLFDPDRFDSYGRFKQVFCKYNNKGELVFSTERLLELLGGMVIRQTVENLGLEGVPSLRDPNWYNEVIDEVTIDPDSSVGQAYLSMAKEAMAELSNEDFLTPNMVLEQILRLRQLLLAGGSFTYNKFFHSRQPDGSVVRDKISRTVKLDGPYPKLDRAQELIAQYQAEGEQVVVFSCFNEPLENLVNHMSISCNACPTCAADTNKCPNKIMPYRFGLLTGKTSQAQRQQMVHDFQQGNLDVILINKIAGAEGLNLQKCDLWPGGSRVMIHLDTWWNPAKEEQANGRCVRMNTNQPVVSHYITAKNSVDGYMRSILEQKAQDIGQLDTGLLRQSLESGLGG